MQLEFASGVWGKTKRNCLILLTITSDNRANARNYFTRSIYWCFWTLFDKFYRMTRKTKSVSLWPPGSKVEHNGPLFGPPCILSVSEHYVWVTYRYTLSSKQRWIMNYGEAEQRAFAERTCGLNVRQKRLLDIEDESRLCSTTFAYHYRTVDMRDLSTSNTVKQKAGLERWPNYPSVFCPVAPTP